MAATRSPSNSLRRRPAASPVRRRSPSPPRLGAGFRRVQLCCPTAWSGAPTSPCASSSPATSRCFSRSAWARSCGSIPTSGAARRATLRAPLRTSHSAPRPVAPWCAPTGGSSGWSSPLPSSCSRRASGSIHGRCWRRAATGLCSATMRARPLCSPTASQQASNFRNGVEVCEACSAAPAPSFAARPVP